MKKVKETTAAKRQRKRDPFDPVRALGLALPGVEEGTMFGTPALRVRGRMFACIASHKSAEPDTLVVCIDFDSRDELIAAEPETYYLTDHYRAHESVSSTIPPFASISSHGVFTNMACVPSGLSVNPRASVNRPSVITTL